LDEKQYEYTHSKNISPVLPWQFALMHNCKWSEYCQRLLRVVDDRVDAADDVNLEGGGGPLMSASRRRTTLARGSGHWAATHSTNIAAEAA
jgi:hypothetical protein